MRPVLLALVLTLAAGPALAGGPAKGPPSEEGAPAEGSHVDVSPFGVPVVVGGKVVNYVFVSVRLHVGAKTEADPLKSKEPRLREALVRAVHRTPMNAPDQRSKVDEARLSKLALGEGERIAGAGKFVRAEVRRQTPQRQLAPVKPRS